MLSIVDNLQFTIKITYKQTLLKVLFILAYSACLRIGELVNCNGSLHVITMENITVIKKRGKTVIQIVLNSYKYSKSASTLILEPSTPLQYCPVNFLLNFLRIRPLKTGPIFIDENSKLINRNFVCKQLKAAVAYNDLDPALFNTHSFRIGRATDLAMSGASDQTIRQTGRWKSIAFLKYIRADFFRLPKNLARIIKSLTPSTWIWATSAGPLILSTCEAWARTFSFVFMGLARCRSIAGKFTFACKIVFWMGWSFMFYG